MTPKELETLVYNWPTNNIHGFNPKEIEQILNQVGKENMNMEKYYNAMMGNTCMMDEHGIIQYHCDILAGLRCGLENRDLTMDEWD